jgi:hypothetical protein
MKNLMMASALSLFMLAIVTPAMAQEPAKTEQTQKKECCKKEGEKKECCKKEAQKKEGCKKQCDKAAETKK